MSGEAFEVAIDNNTSLNTIFDAIFIGGSGGNIQDIIKSYDLKLKDNGKMVLNFITIDNLYKAMSTLKELSYETECMQIGVSKTKGKSYMLFANNPIFILSSKKVTEGK